MGITARIPFRKGSDFDPSFWLEDDNGARVDLSGYGMRLQIRAHYSDAEPLIDIDSEDTPTVATWDTAHQVCSVDLRGGTTAGMDTLPDSPAEWVTDVEFYVIGSTPESVQNGGSYIIDYMPEATR